MPEPCAILDYHEEQSSWVQDFSLPGRAAVSLLIETLNDQSWCHKHGIFYFVGANQKNAGCHLQCLEVFIEACVKLPQLQNKSEVGIHAPPALFHVDNCIFISALLRKDLVGEHYGRRTRNALHTVYVDFAALVARVLDELDGVVKDALDVFSHVVLQVV